jgi:hypothetical protein
LQVAGRFIWGLAASKQESTQILQIKAQATDFTESLNIFVCQGKTNPEYGRGI